MSELAEPWATQARDLCDEFQHSVSEAERDTILCNIGDVSTDLAVLEAIVVTRNELLAALKEVRAALPWSDDHNPFPDDPRWGKAMKMADEAIAKATGGAG